MTIKAFVDLVEKHAKPEMVVAEVGVWTGDTTINYLPFIAKNNGKMIAVDTFCGNVTATGGTHVYMPKDAEHIYKRFMERVLEYAHLVEVLRGTSHEMAALIPDHSLDICFLDASHIYKDVKKDIELYSVKVKPGGIFCGHDCDDLAWANTYTPEELEMDCTNDKGHAGVIQAVWDAYGNSVEIIPGYDYPNIWMKQL